MTATKQSDGSLLLTYDSSLWSKWAIGLTLLLLATSGYDHFIGTRGDERLIGLLAGAATTALTALVILEQSRFRIDPMTRLIEWEQRWAAEAIRAVLGQAPSNITDSLRALIFKGRTISAIKLLREHEGISLAEAKRRVEEIIRQEYS